MSVLFASSFVVSCEKADLPVTLPEKGEAEFETVEMGEEYTDQLFYDFESARVVHISQIKSWDLAFDASPEGFNVFINGGSDLFVYKTGQTDMSSVKTAPNIFSEDWTYDASCGLKDSTAIGDWTNGSGLSKGQVFVIKLNESNNPDNLHKIKMVSVTSTEYVMEYASLEEDVAHTITIPKDNAYNFAYFSFFEGGKVVKPDPPKDTWDIVFTRYRYIYHELDDFPYIVSGVLINPYKTEGFADSTTGFEKIEGEWVLQQPFSNHRDVVGFDWKSYDIDKATYTVNPDKCYVIRNRDNKYWKLHFLNFYNNQGIKGSPSFEFQRVY